MKQALAQKGVTVRPLHNQNSGVQAMYVEDQQGRGSIYLRNDGLTPEKVALTHEITHFLRNSAHYGELEELTFRYLEQQGVDTAALGRQLAESYQEIGKELDEAGQREEITALFAGEHLLEDTRFIKRLTVEKPSLARRVLEWIEDKLAGLGKGRVRKLLLAANRKYLQAFREAGRIIYLSERGLT